MTPSQHDKIMMKIFHHITENQNPCIKNADAEIVLDEKIYCVYNSNGFLIHGYYDDANDELEFGCYYDDIGRLKSIDSSFGLSTDLYIIYTENKITKVFIDYGDTRVCKILKGNKSDIIISNDKLEYFVFDKNANIKDVYIFDMSGKNPLVKLPEAYIELLKNFDDWNGFDEIQEIAYEISEQREERRNNRKKVK